MRELAMILVLVMTGCISSRLGDFSVLSSKNIPMTGMTVLEAGVEAKDCRTRPFPFTGPPYIAPSVEDAADRAIEQVKGANALTDVVVHLNVWDFLLVARWCYNVKGDAAKIR